MKMKALIGKGANEFLEKFGLSTSFYEIARDLEDARKKLGSFSFPLVLKLIPKDALHNMPGGVKIVYSKELFAKEFESLVDAAKKNKVKLEGVMMQEFIEGLELRAGLKKDATFGHVIMFGLGGIYVEALRDVTFRVCPINDRDASEMISDLKGKEIILSKRKNLDIDKLKKVLVKISKLPQKKRDISELDINPLIINSDGVRAVDVRVILD